VNGNGSVEAAISHLPAKAAKMAAIEILLSDPESLGDDTEPFSTRRSGRLLKL
jgi:hypothetical protein